MAGVGWRVDPFTLTVPPGAPPNSPGIVIGGAPFPPELVTFYNAEGATIIGAIIMRETATTYVYDALIIDSFGDANKVVGRVDAAVVSEVYRILTSGVTALEFGFRLPVPSVIYNGAGSLRLTNGYRLDVSGKTVTGQTASLSQLATAGLYGAAAFANIPGAPSVTITKLYDATFTDLVCEYSIGAFANAAPTQMNVAVNPGTGAQQGGIMFFNVANNHDIAVGLNRLSGLAAGSYTINLMWGTGGANILNQNNGDWNALKVEEVAVP